MLKITLDIFSGQPNPSWVIDDASAQDVLREVSKSRGAVTDINSGFQGLGYRGYILEFQSSELAKKYSLPQTFRVTSSNSLNESKASEILQRWQRGGQKSVEKWSGNRSGVEKGEKAIGSSALLQDSDSFGIEDGAVHEEADVAQGLTAKDSLIAATTCSYDKTAYNPNFWNQSSVQPYNNCYNYATNRRTDTFAQPGKGGGAMYSAINCTEVTKGTLKDGGHKRYNCFPSSEYPRYLIALVIAPGPSFKDFHWYRLQKEGFWGHKPGSTAARNVDNKQKIIYNPETCDRGPYTIFCGYFYTAKSMKVK